MNQPLQTDYSVLVAQRLSRGECELYYIAAPGLVENVPAYYYVYAAFPSFMLAATVTAGTADYDDFEIALKPSASSVSDQNEAVARSLPTEKKSSDGVPSTRNLSYDPDRSPFRPGYRFTITPGVQNQWDILMDPATMVGTDGTVQIMGGSLWVPVDASRNDYIEILVIDKTGVLPDIVDGQHSSLMAHYGLPTDGSTYLEVSDKIVRQGNVPVGNPAGRSFNPGGNFKAYGGLYLRVIYNATAAVYTGPLGLDLNLAK